MIVVWTRALAEWRIGICLKGNTHLPFMPTARLTVSLPSEEIEFLQKYAQQHCLTLTEIVARYLQRLKSGPEPSIHPEVAALAGLVPPEIDAEAGKAPPSSMRSACARDASAKRPCQMRVWS